MSDLVERVARHACRTDGDCQHGETCDRPCGQFYQELSRAAIAEVFDWLDTPMSSDALNAGAAIVGNDGDAFDAFQHMLAVLRKDAGI